MKKLIIILGIILYTITLIHFVNTYTADINFKKSQRLISKKKVESALKNVDKAISKNPLEPKYYWGRAKILLTATAGESEEIKKNLKEHALKDMKKAYALNENNLVTIRNLVPLYYFIAARDVNLPYGPDNIDENYLEVTKKYYKGIKNVSPNDAGVYTLLAKYEKRLNLDAAYEESINNIIQLRPDLLEWHPNIIQ